MPSGLTKQLLFLMLLSSTGGLAYAEPSAGHIEALCHGGAGLGRPVTSYEARGLLVGSLVRDAAHVHSSLGIDHENQVLKEKFDNKVFSCELSVKPDGAISYVKIHQSSGSEQIDRNALALIKSAAPFGPTKIYGSETNHSTDFLYLIEFPLLNIKPLN